MQSDPKQVGNMRRLARACGSTVTVELLLLLGYVASMRHDARPLYPPSLEWTLFLLVMPFRLLLFVAQMLLDLYDARQERLRAEEWRRNRTR